MSPYYTQRYSLHFCLFSSFLCVNFPFLLFISIHHHYLPSSLFPPFLFDLSFLFLTLSITLSIPLCALHSFILRSYVQLLKYWLGQKGDTDLHAFLFMKSGCLVFMILLWSPRVFHLILVLLIFYGLCTVWSSWMCAFLHYLEWFVPGHSSSRQWIA